MPNVRSAKPAMNIIKAATLYLVLSEPLLSKKVSAAKEFDSGMTCFTDFFLDENIFIFLFLLNYRKFSSTAKNPLTSMRIKTIARFNTK